MIRALAMTGTAFLLGTLHGPWTNPVVDIRSRIQSLIDWSSDAAARDKLEDAINKVDSALVELQKSPPDLPAAVGNLEGAVGDLEAAVQAGFVTLSAGTTLMNDAAGIPRAMALDEIDHAVAASGDSTVIADAQAFVDQGNTLRAAGEFKNSISKYKDGVSKALSAQGGAATVTIVFSTGAKITSLGTFDPGNEGVSASGNGDRAAIKAFAARLFPAGLSFDHPPVVPDPVEMGEVSRTVVTGAGTALQFLDTVIQVIGETGADEGRVRVMSERETFNHTRTTGSSARLSSTQIVSIVDTVPEGFVGVPLGPPFETPSLAYKWRTAINVHVFVGITIIHLVEMRTGACGSFFPAPSLGVCTFADDHQGT